MVSTGDTTISLRSRRGVSEEAEVEFIMSALDAADYPQGRRPRDCRPQDRRGAMRQPYRVRAALQLFAGISDGAPLRLFTRDVTSRSLGFITRHRLPLGYGGVVDLLDPRGVIRSIDCTVRRCREVAQGWYEGALCFNREQRDFDPE